MNIFQSTYEARLQDWFQLRTSVTSLPIEQQCVTIDEWWQQCPLVTHHLHPQDIDNWPDPWELLSENTYCEVARALGMCYTLHLIGVNDIELVLARNNTAEDIVLVLVDNAKYILNYWPNTVISNTLKDFKVVDRLDIKKIKDKIGKI
jgi:diadenosine tetraphosphatase ApaH/serine/threonine PP2A family protein phosphatase